MEWIISANHNKYDHTRAFNELPYIDWKQNANYNIGDKVYIYSTRPTSAVEYLAEVIDVNIDVKNALDDRKYWTDLSEYYNGLEKRRYARFKLLYHFDDSNLSLDLLHQNGLVGNIQGPRKLYDENGNLFPWAEYIHKVLDKETDDAELIGKIENDLKDTNSIVGKTKEVLIKARVNQSVFRDKLLKRYGKCCLCGIANKNLLIASHIKPWSNSNNKEKLDVDNGLLLCPNHDALFDSGYISFDNDGNIMISNSLSINDRILLNVSNDMKIKLSAKNKEYLKYHQNHIFRR